MEAQYNQIFRSDFSVEYKESGTSEQTAPHHHADYEIFLNLTPQLSTIITFDSAAAQKQYGTDLLLKMRLAELLIFINSLYCDHHHIQHGALNPQYSRIYQVIEFIHNHFQDPLSLDLLEKHFFINKYYLSTLFKEVTGTSIIQYIVHCRITCAKTLLTNGLHVDDVCAQAGFQNLSHFSRTFKNIVGESPKQFQMHTKM